MEFQNNISKELSQNDHSKLLLALQNGDKNAFDTLYFQYWEEAYHSGFKWTKDSEIVKDALQEVFTAIWLNRKKPISNLEAYLKIAIRNRIFKVLEKTKELDPWTQVLDNYLISDLVADRNIRSDELLGELEKVVSGLPPQRQKIVRLRFMEDCSTRFIAESMGITQKTVQNQLSRAVASMKIDLMQGTMMVLLLINWGF